MEMDDKNVDCTALVTHHGLFKSKRMLPALKNAPSALQHTMDAILVLVKWQRGIVYVDDNIDFLESPEQHLLHVEKLLRLLHDAGTKSKLKRIFFFRNTVDYLVYAIP